MAEHCLFFTTNILAFYRNHARALPWRQSNGTSVSPYHTLVSEIMLQQTQVRKVIDYFNRFMRAFPDLESLAQAQQEEVHAQWAGLGYYRRADLLHTTVQKINRDKKFPRTVPELEKLPGIGPYTSRSIASIAFQVPAIALDTNAIRVIIRFFGLQPDSLRDLQSWSDHRLLPLLSATTSSSFTQGLMELGSLICRSKSPECSLCPIQKRCQAHLTQNYRSWKVSKPQKRKETRWDIYLFTAEHKVLQWNTQDTKLYRGLWTFPWEEDRNSPFTPWIRELMSASSKIQNWEFSYQVTNKKVQAIVHLYQSPLMTTTSHAPRTRWSALQEIGDKPSSSLVRKVIEQLQKTVQKDPTLPQR